MNALYENIEHYPVTLKDISEASRKIRHLTEGMVQVVEGMIGEMKGEGYLYVMSCCLVAVHEELLRILPNDEVEPS